METLERLYHQGDFATIYETVIVDNERISNRIWKIIALGGMNLVDKAEKEINILGSQLHLLNFNEQGFYYRAVGDFFFFKGFIDKSAFYYSKGLDLLESTTYYAELAKLHLGLANVHVVRMQFQEGVDQIQNAITLFKSSKNKIWIGISYFNLGEIYQKTNQFTLAQEHLNVALSYVSEYSDLLPKLYILTHLVWICCDVDDIENAIEYNNELREFYTIVPTPLSKLLVNISEARVLTKSKRSRDKIKAQIILEDILELSKIHNDYYYFVLTQLIELLLFEYKSYEEDIVLQEIFRYLDHLTELGELRQDDEILINSLVLQAKLHQIQYNFGMSMEILEKGLKIAEKYESTSHIYLIRDEMDHLRLNFKKLDAQLSTSTLKERIEKSQIFDYIEKARQQML